MPSSTHRHLILASSSPYRRELLQRLQLPFSVVAPDVDEHRQPGETPHSLAQRLACEKAAAVAARHPDAWVIGADQTASLHGHDVLGKPGNHDAAVLQLRAASGRSVVFHSGVCLISPNSTQEHDVVSTEVRFRTLSELEIERYLRAETPYDCAGSAKAEGLGVSLLQAQHGSDPSALIGLPLIRLCEMLRAAGWSIP
jgi:septum formation protein